jgi:alkanesulfonate monooxygenase SsuD/methylene tetrahydromethanopterin reductase-like flavin-dependent oxidoreductase (luciferase family)
MQIGLTLPTMVANLDRPTILEWMQRIDAGPFSSLAAGERIAFPNQELMVTMAAAAAVTTRVRLVTTIVILPMHSAPLIAKQAATLDVLSGGRLTLGLGVGGRDEDYRAVGASFARRVTRLAEQVSVMRAVWRGEQVVPNVNPIGPRPVQPGGPDLLIGAMLPGSIRRAAEWADGVTGWSFKPDPVEVAGTFRMVADAWKEAGRTTRPRLVTGFWFALGKNGREQMDAYVRSYLGNFGDSVAGAIAKGIAATSAAAVRDACRALADVGTDELILVPTTADLDEIDRLEELIAGLG